MADPALAIVRPRIIGADGERRLLEDLIEHRLSHGGGGGVVVIIAGPAGSGKTTALRHIQAWLDLRPEWRGRCRFVDTTGSLSWRQSGTQNEQPSELTIAAARVTSVDSSQRLSLAGWGRDEIIEYVLARHPAECSSIMSRTYDESLCEGLPLLLTIAIDQLAADASLPNISRALERHLETLNLTTEKRSVLGRLAWATMNSHVEVKKILKPWLDSIEPESCRQFILMEPIQSLLACEYYVKQLRCSRGLSILKERLPDDLLPAVVDVLRHESEVLDQLSNLLTHKSDRALHAAAATLLTATDRNWRPKNDLREVILSEATLNGVSWQGIDFTGANFHNASLIGADLSNATLVSATFDSACLKRASFQAANLTGIVHLAHCDASEAKFQKADLAHAIFDEAELERANFDGANLKGSWLTNSTLNGASFRNADLSEAILLGSKLPNCDFTEAILQFASLNGLDLTTCLFDGASLEGASLWECLLEGIYWDRARLARAKLRRACLTGSQLPFADLRSADLSYAAIAEIDWEHADLRGANLYGAVFHMGSCRGGLVSSPFACEGSKTGFYTEEFHELHFKAPEEIRKANLRGADLRGADLRQVDFYLVDLRGAKLDPDQLEIARNCGAILNDWVVD